MPSMSDKVIAMALTYPNEIALTQNGTHWTYGELVEDIETAKAKLKALGLNSQDKVALALPNLKETVVLFYALNALDITVVMCHPLSSAINLRDRCRLLKVDALFILDVLENRTRKQIREFRVIRVKAIHGFLGWIVGLRSPLMNPDAKDWDKIQGVKTESSKTINQDAVILFSSGTSGNQKAISLSNEAFNALADQMETVIDPKRGVDSMFCVLPFFHGFGLGIAMHTVLALGGRCILVPRIKRKTVIQTLLKEKPTYVAAVPYLLKVLLKDESFIHADLSFIRQVFVGGETVSLRLIEDFNDVLARQGSKAKVQVGYGCTESVTAVTLMKAEDSLSNGVGTPFVGNEILIVNEDGTPSAINEEGEILITGPTLMNGYWGDPQATADAFRMVSGIRYYVSQDLGHLDEKGILHFHHRKDDLIKVKGYLINPKSILDRLTPIDGITDVRLLTDDQDRLVVLMMVSNQADHGLLRKKTIQAVNDLDGWCRPQRFMIVDEFPLNEMRKTDYGLLKLKLRNQALRFQSEWFL